jgi:DNA (cytosine-5)-methyltransferase 1
MVLKYISLFSGIGGFEVAIHRLYPRAVCVGYSEIDPKALAIYERNFPKHRNMGDVTRITKSYLMNSIQRARGCDLVVAGFPCNDLSRINPYGKGLEGSKSKLFYQLLRILRIIVKEFNPNVKVVIENNVGMKPEWASMITNDLLKVIKDVHLVSINSGNRVVQARKRYFWVSCNVPDFMGKRLQSWSDILEPLQSDNILKDEEKHVPLAVRKNSFVECSNNETLVVKEIHAGIYEFVKINTSRKCSRWEKYPHQSDTRLVNSKTIITKSMDCALLDRRGCAEGTFRIRRFTVKELARLFTFDDDHLPEGTSVNAAYGLFGKAVVVKVVEHVLKHLLK